MDCCRCNCAYISVIIAILAGVALGVLSAFGLIATGIIFWVFLLSGILAILLSPLYTAGGCKCFVSYCVMLLAAAIGTVISAAVGLIVAAVASVTVLSIVLGIAGFFVVLLLGTVVCLTNCLCQA